VEGGRERDDFFFLILFFHCGVARDKGSRGFFFNMLKGDGREFFFYVEKG
jgi:hypothetical protein